MKLLFETPGWNIGATKVISTSKKKEKVQKQNKSRKRKRDHSNDVNVDSSDFQQIFEQVTDKTSNNPNEQENHKEDKDPKSNGDISSSKKSRKNKNGLKEIHVDAKSQNHPAMSTDSIVKKNDRTKITSNKTNQNDNSFQKKNKGEISANLSSSLTPLQAKMQKRLKGGRFRWINEQLYTINSEEAFKLVQENPEIFEEYHEGFRSQVASWPSPPLNHYVSLFKQTLDPVQNFIIADMGCGDGALSLRLPKHRILSYDLVKPKGKEHIIPCDIAHVPLPDGFVDVVLFCLSLMGTNWIDFVMEAYRILRDSAIMHIAEVKSRISDTKAFITLIEQVGFKLSESDDSSDKMFLYFVFKKVKPLTSESKKSKANESLIENGASLLKPCIYKKR